MPAKYILPAKLASLIFLVALSSFFMAEPITLKGIIKDAQSKQPLSGVTIKEIGTQQSTLTGADGQFSLRVSAKNALLKISLAGYVTQSVLVISDSADVTIFLQPEPAALQEVVVTGSAIKKNLQTTASVSADRKSVV